MRAKKDKTKKFSLTDIIVKGVLLVAVFSMVGTIVANQLEIAEKKQDLIEIETIVAAQIADNEELELLIASGEIEMVERVAREEYGYAAPSERLFVDVSGK